MRLLNSLLSLAVLVVAILLAAGVGGIAPAGTPRWDEVEMSMLLLLLTLGNMILQQITYERRKDQDD